MHFIVWNIDPEVLGLGPITVRWYGFFFALGFLSGYRVLVQIYRNETRSEENLSNLFLYIFFGTVLGARLGHVLFYQPDSYLGRPWEILMIWEGGLASHGGFIGVLVGIYLYVRKYDEMTFLELADRLAIPCLLAASCIRIGNFFNSEIIGRPSDLPWAIIFFRVDNIPRHPAMLYESFAYAVIFAAMYTAYWKSEIVKVPGLTLGVILVTSFVARFVIEFVKEEQVAFELGMPLNMGQLLSVPFILFGVVLIYNSIRHACPKRAQVKSRVRETS